MAGATDFQHVVFATLFFCDKINFRWQQYKTQVKRNNITTFTWDKFKVFLQQSLRKSTLFITSIWIKIKQDSQYK